jgi:putative Holliday junction resolvase
MLTNSDKTGILALDVGSKRIGVAAAHVQARLPRPVTTLPNDENIFNAIMNIVSAEDAGIIVVGLPRGLNGQETQQTEYTRSFVRTLIEKTDMPIYFQDEAVTSRLAEEDLRRTGKAYDRADIDAQAATRILDDYLHEKEY